MLDWICWRLGHQAGASETGPCLCGAALRVRLAMPNGYATIGPKHYDLDARAVLALASYGDDAFATIH